MRMPVLMVVWSSAGAGSSAQSAFCNVAPHHQLHFNTIEPSFTATARVCLQLSQSVAGPGAKWDVTLYYPPPLYLYPVFTQAGRGACAVFRMSSRVIWQDTSPPLTITRAGGDRAEQPDDSANRRAIVADPHSTSNKGTRGCDAVMFKFCRYN